MFRIKRLDIFIAKQFCLLFVGTFFICLFVLMMQFLWSYIDELIGKGLSLDVLAQFFWYMGLKLVPQAFPLAILLSSLITFGNLGESSELTAIKAAGISLMQAFRSLFVIVLSISFGSFYFQDVINPSANLSFYQLLISMKQKSPELEIPEGVFYDGIPGSNMYVQKKDMETGMLYGIMIYRMSGSYEDAAIILADSGMLQSTAEKKHLVMTLHSGEWFENMKNQELAGSASVPYRRETFIDKKLVFDFDTDINMLDIGMLSNDARGKSLSQIRSDVDSLNHYYDSIGRGYYNEIMIGFTRGESLSKKDSARAEQTARAETFNIDSLFDKLSPEKKQTALSNALHEVQMKASDYEFKSMLTSDGNYLIRRHKIEAMKKFTLALQCLLFFFIGAPLGAIIRKGGLGFPVIISVLVFIIYLIFDNTGFKMSRSGIWTIWFGNWIALAALTPLAVFVTYKANNDSTVFNWDLYRNMLMRIFGIRMKRNIYGKEVIIDDPQYDSDVIRLCKINEDIESYNQQHHLLFLPNVRKVFFVYEPDREIERISEELESIIEDLSNSRDKVIINELNNYPVMATKAHTRPFNKKWENIVAALIVPVGAFFYLRMWRFRLRLFRDLKVVKHTNDTIVERINVIYNK